MATTTRAFLEALKAQIVALMIGDDPLAVFVAVVRDINEDVVAALPNHPAVLICDRGGQRNRSTLVKDLRSVDICFVDSQPRDNWGEQSVFSALDAGEVIEAALEGDTTNSVYLVEDFEEENYGDYGGGLDLLGKTWRYRYVLHKTANTGMYPIPGQLVIPTTSYTSGGTLLGEKLSIGVMGLSRSVDLLPRPHTAPYWSEARINGENTVFSVVLGERSENVMEALFGSRHSGGTVYMRGSAAGFKPGHLLDESDYIKFLLRPTDPDHPYLLFPRCVVTQVGPIQFGDTDVDAMEACEVVFAASMNPDNAGTVEPGIWGDPDNFPALV